MNSCAIFVCLAPQGEHWQLGPLNGSLNGPLLIGWRVDPEPIDAGMPVAVAWVLARALVKEFRVGCLRSQNSPVKTAPNSSLFASTRDPETLVALLDDPAFPWSLQGQVALLWDANANASLELTSAEIATLFGSTWWLAVANIPDVLGVLRPGVDGDVVGLFIPSPDRRESWLSAFKKECDAAELRLEFVDQSTLVEQI